MTADLAAAARALDEHVVEIVRWHFSEETGTPFWLDLARDLDWDPRAEIGGFDDLSRLPRFDASALRDEPHERFIPRAYASRPYLIFETGGTTGRPTQRLGWDDHRIDYEAFSETLDPAFFPPGSAWLALGPTGPRRLRVAIEHLAHHRGGPCYHVDLDPRWVRKLAARGDDRARDAYSDHVVQQGVEVLKHRDVRCLFTTPRILEALGAVCDVTALGIRGVFCGGTSMTPQSIRFLVEEVLEGRADLVPTYGNTLMGLARAAPVGAEHGFDLTYFAPQPRAVLRVVDPGDPDTLVEPGAWGRVELTTLTRELFAPRMLERDEGIRRPAHPRWPWEGVGEVRPLGIVEEKTTEGVY